MTRFEQFKNMDIEALAEWICENGQFDGSPWMTWWDEKYCQKCEPVMCHHTEAKDKLGFEPFFEKDVECAWCETNGKCKYFQEMNEIPSCKDIVKLWLESNTIQND